MANLDINNPAGYVEPTFGRGLTNPVYDGGTDVEDSLLVGALTVQDLRDNLAALNAGYYTAARLETLTRNDMVYAMRVAKANSF